MVEWDDRQSSHPLRKGISHAFDGVDSRISYYDVCGRSLFGIFLSHLPVIGRMVVIDGDDCDADERVDFI